MDERFTRMEELFAEAIERPSAERDAFLREHCGDDAEMLEELRRLIRGDELAGEDFLRLPPPDPRWAEVLRAPAVDPLIGARLAGFTIQRLLARGGMGTVYLAEQERPHRQVALKVLHTGLWSRSAAKRFEFESQVLAHLSHPHIAQVYEAGTARLEPAAGGGQVREVPYFAMEYVPEARTLTQYAAEHQLGLEERLKQFLQVCDAVHHGHQKGIIHRDLKPANLLVDAEGRAKVIDFGVARAVDGDVARTTMHTEAGHLVGTLAYMSPEQCEADPHAIDVRSDLYSLGVVLYELLCGRLPYDVSKTSVYAATRVIREAAPARPSVVTGGDSGCPAVRGDLETILLKALEKDRADRYQSAEALARDLRHYLAGELIEAQAPTVTRVVLRFVRRYRSLCIAMAGLFTVLIAGVAIGSFLAVSASRAKAAAEAHAYAAKIQAAEAALLAYQPAQAKQLLDAAQDGYQFSQDSDRKMPWEWRHLHNRLTMDAGRRDVSHSLWSLALDPGEAERFIAVGGKEGIHIFPSNHEALADKEETRLTGSKNYRGHVAFNPDGSLLAAGTTDIGIRLWRFSQGSRQKWQPIEWEVDERSRDASSPAFHPSRPVLASSHDDGAVRLWDLKDLPENGQFVPPVPAELRGHQRSICELTFDAQGNYLASASCDATVRLWDVHAALSGEREPLSAILLGHTDHVVAVAFSPDGARLASGSTDNTIRLWDVKKSVEAARGDGRHEPTGTSPGVTIGILRGHTAAVTALAWDRSGTRLYSAGGDQVIRVWDVDENGIASDALRQLTASSPVPQREALGMLYGHGGVVCDLSVRKDGRIMSCSNDGTIRVWDSDAESVPSLGGLHGGHQSNIQSVAFTPEDDYLLSAGADSAVYVWDPNTGVPRKRLFPCDSQQEAVWAAVILPQQDSPIAVVATMGSSGDESPYQDHGCGMQGRDYGRLLFLNLEDPQAAVSGKPLHVAEGRHPYHCLAVSRNGRRLAAGGFDVDQKLGFIQVWDCEQPRDPQKIQDWTTGASAPVFALMFLDEQGTWLASSQVCSSPSEDTKPSTIQVWRAESGELQPNEANAFQGNFWSLALSPDGQSLASGSSDGPVRLWNIEPADDRLRLAEAGVLAGHTSSVFAVVFHPSERRLFSGSADGTIKVWDLATRTEVATLHGNLGQVTCLAFDRTRDRLASGTAGFQGDEIVVRLWEAKVGSEEEAPEVRLGRASVRRAQQAIERAFSGPIDKTVEQIRRSLADDDRLTEDVHKILEDHFDELLPHPRWLCRWAGGVASKAGGEMRDYELGLDLANTAARLAPEFTTAHFERGVLLCRLKRFEKALAAFRRAAETRLEPGGWTRELWACVAWVEQKAGRSVEAEEARRQMRTFNKPEGSSYFFEHPGLEEEVYGGDR